MKFAGLIVSVPPVRDGDISGLCQGFNALSWCIDVRIMKGYEMGVVFSLCIVKSCMLIDP